LAPGGGQPVGRVEWPPLTWLSPPHVDAWQPRLGPHRLKPWAADPWAHSAWGHAHLVHMSNAPVVIMILTFCQLHFVIH
jgi:hypothetical protein